MTTAKGLSSGYIPIAASIVSDKVASVIDNAGDFNHGYTYSGHPVAAAVALENLRILEEENIVAYVADVAAPYLRERWLKLADHPLVGEARCVGLMGALELTPDKANRTPFKEGGAAGLICRTHCFDGGLVMRATGDTMIISPPLVISTDEIDMLIARATGALDKTYADVKAQNLL